MRERADMHCLHEPFMYDYYLNPQRPQATRDMPHFSPEKDHPHEYAGIRDLILERAESRPVFFKDMSYYLTPYLESADNSDTEFVERINHCFLIRNPKATIASYFAMDKEVTLEEIGIEAQWRHIVALQRAGIRPYVLEAEAVQNDPRGQIKNWWNALGLTPVESAMNWNNDAPQEWTQVQAWHQSTLASTAIRKRTSKDDQVEQQRFDDAVKTAPHLQSYLEHHAPFYHRLQALVAENQHSKDA